MTGLESQEEDAPKRVLFYKPMAWLGQIRPHRRDESWSASLCQTFFSTSMGAQIPVISEKPLAVCGCRKFKIDALGDHLCTCSSHSGSVDQLPDLFRTTHKVKTQFLQTHRETDRFLQLQEFSFRKPTVTSSTQVPSLLTKTSSLLVTHNLDGAPITSESHTHPSHSQTSRLLTSSLS
jgi:hypothetical protein